MANKWRTTITDADWVFVKYSINPSDVSTETLVRKIAGIDKSVLQTLITAQKAITSVIDPVVDNQTYTGTWTVKTLDPNPDEQGNTAGSADIVQVLSKGSYGFITLANTFLVRSRAYAFEQNENAWMYYERFKSEETYRWNNLTYAGLYTNGVYDVIRQITTMHVSNLQTSGTYAFGTKWSYAIVFDTWNWRWWSAVASANFSPVYRINMPTGWQTIDNPIIRECWYETNSDGTYDLFRTLETTSEPAIVKVRPLQYAGMTLVQGSPILDDTVLTISGLNYKTETIYANARFRIGGDTYRVLDDQTCVDGQVTLNVNPAITQATEDLVDANLGNTQVFWDAL